MTVDLNRLQNLVAQAPAKLAPHPGQSWFNIKNIAGSPTQIYIHNEIGEYGITSSDFAAALGNVNGDVEVHINSEGGNVWQGLGIYASLRQHKGNVTTIIDGLAASAASFIAMAATPYDAESGTGGVRMEKRARMMVHDAATGYGQVAGNAANFREFAAEIMKAAEFLDDTSNNIADIYAEKAGGTAKQWRARMEAETWLNAEEARKAGLVDAIVGESPTVSNNSKAPEETTFRWDPTQFANMMKEVLA